MLGKWPVIVPPRGLEKVEVTDGLVPSVPLLRFQECKGLLPVPQGRGRLVRCGVNRKAQLVPAAPRASHCRMRIRGISRYLQARMWNLNTILGTVGPWAACRGVHHGVAPLDTAV